MLSRSCRGLSLSVFGFLEPTMASPATSDSAETWRHGTYPPANGGRMSTVADSGTRVFLSRTLT